ncbi:CDKN2AIP N-terminal-like protein isoform X1 [Molossus molossus]|uniref:CDKN2AIP N-terminal-like protein isoform X1 n=1 Tax=Molossus molossus TaxID=27622 RepID=UPI001746580E|nr:CDKN2AIP N-terminal-like protein isoform X1 [Molossus molossus]
MVGGEAAAAVEELVSGVRQATDFAEQFRSYSESEKQWKARMEFIRRHLPDYRDPPDGGGRLDQLLSLSMVWANHLFLGCSYNKDLLDKVMEMADGIEIEDLPQFTTRSELMKKQEDWAMNRSLTGITLLEAQQRWPAEKSPIYSVVNVPKLKTMASKGRTYDSTMAKWRGYFLSG